MKNAIYIDRPVKVKVIFNFSHSVFWRFIRHGVSLIRNTKLTGCYFRSRVGGRAQRGFYRR